MVSWLEKFPDLMTKEEAAEVLRCAPSMVPRLKGLKKTRVGNGRGKVLWRKGDLLDYINSRVEEEEVIEGANKQAQRYRKMGVSSIISWEELQKARMEYSGRGG